MSLPPPRRNAWSAREKRYDWFRVYNSFVGHPKFKVVAAACGISISEASMIGVALFTTANRAKPSRGSVADFNALEVGAALDIPPEKIALAYAKFEDMGWIDQDYMSTWDDRQPDKEDTTAAERKRRQRDKLKKQRQGLVPGAPPPAAAPSVSDEDAEARVWLIADAPKVVADALGVRELAAVATLTAWVNDIGKDYVALREILRGVIGQKANGVSFRNQVGQRIKEHKAGPRLPLGLTVVGGASA